jgi:hypothetical protein
VPKLKRSGDTVIGPDYPTVQPTNETMNAIVETFMVRTEVLRRACLICGRWGTAEANRAVARAIQSLSFAAESQGGYTWYIALREFGASICFYWNLAGLLDREAWGSIQALQSTEIEVGSGSEVVVSTLPFASNEGVNWKFLSNLEQRHTPISDYLTAKFVAEASDIALGEARAYELFDRTELAVAVEFAHRRVEQIKTTGIGFWMSVGRFIWKSNGTGLENELKRIEGLADSDAFFRRGCWAVAKRVRHLHCKQFVTFTKRLPGSFGDRAGEFATRGDIGCSVRT